MIIMKKLLSSYDIIGSREKAVVVVEISDELINEKKKIAEQIMKRHKNVKSVLRKVSERKGIFRIREFELLAGSEDTEVIHKESGCMFKLDPKKVYFSPREGTERLRIAGQVKSGEFVLVMFAGVGPFGILIAKKQPNVKGVVCIEINPVAYEYMKQNILLNKVEDKVLAVLGDVREKAKEWYGKCDRVLMPLPMEAWKYMDIASKCLTQNGGTIHLYLVENEDKVEPRVKELVETLDRGNTVTYRIRKVLPYAPHVNKYCVDIRITTAESRKNQEPM